MDKKKTIRREALQFLKDNVTAVVATNFDGELNAATVYYALDDDFTFYFISKRKTDKPIDTVLYGNVALVVGTGPEYTTVQAKGKIEVVKNEEEVKTVFEKFKRLYTTHPVKHWPIQTMVELKEKKPIIFKIIPHKLTFMNIDNEKYPESRGTKYQPIIS